MHLTPVQTMVIILAVTLGTQITGDPRALH